MATSSLPAAIRSATLDATATGPTMRRAKAQATVKALQDELAETNRGLVALAMELEQRVEERTDFVKMNLVDGYLVDGRLHLTQPLEQFTRPALRGCGQPRALDQFVDLGKTAMAVPVGHLHGRVFVRV